MEKIAHIALQNGVIEAIAICRKSIEVINFREEEPRLELWKCLINLYFFFVEDFSKFKSIFYEALAANIKMKIMEHIEVLCKSQGRYEVGERLLEDYLKRVDVKEDAWLRYISYLLECKTLKLKAKLTEEEGDDIEAEYKDKVKTILKRSLQSLLKHRHVFFLSRYAVLEYKNGDSQTGRSNFENLVSSFPNRIDIWGVYLDMEIKYYNQNREEMRDLFDRILGLDKLKMKTAKNIFKKLLKYEEQYGGKGRAQVVKKRAMEYVNSKSNNI